MNLRNAVESSAVVRVFRPMGDGSIVCRSLVLLVRFISLRSSYLGRRLALLPPPPDFRRSIRVLSGSIVCSSVERFFVLAMRAWRENGARHRVVASLDSLESWQQVRLLGWSLFVCGFIDALFYPLDFSGGLMGLFNSSLLLVIVVTLIWGARPVAVAWAARWRVGRQGASPVDASVDQPVGNRQETAAGSRDLPVAAPHDFV